MTTRDEWLQREITKNDTRIAELQRRNRQLRAEMTTTPPEELAAAQRARDDAARIAEIREAHDAAQLLGDKESKGYRAYLLTQALEHGFSKYRLAKVLNVSRGMVYHYLDPDYQKKLNQRRKDTTP